MLQQFGEEVQVYYNTTPATSMGGARLQGNGTNPGNLEQNNYCDRVSSDVNKYGQASTHHSGDSIHNSSSKKPAHICGSHPKEEDNLTKVARICPGFSRGNQECLEHHKWVDSNRLEMKVRQIYDQDSSLTVEEIAQRAGVNKTTVYKYLRYLPKQKKSKKW